ncbi:hypothetical protein NECAME_07613 [Necator americanus]|uniref:Uncharacterized protein n=1 Tax=Necator americanus TaxID=51031 RepID=W2TPF8_NECAM|nr:hypothetical protein NECAME_07613 [Necator americanus]ETN83021.1 hypothetical protein NECAME_07613 [Necator americanus]
MVHIGCDLVCLVLFIMNCHVKSDLTTKARLSLLQALRGVNLEERQTRLKNLAKLYFGNTTSTIRQNNNVASAVIDVDVKEFVTGSINDPSIEEINRKEGVSEFLFQGDINLTDEQLDWIERNIDIRKNTRSKRQVDSGARLWSNNRVFYFFDISIGPPVASDSNSQDVDHVVVDDDHFLREINHNISI